MPRVALRRLTLTDYRSYARAELALEGGPVFLFGPNGAGKTNLIEAVSYLAPGKGLRNCTAPEVGRRLPGEAAGRAWSVAVEVDAGDERVRLGTGLDAAAGRRIVRIEGETVASGRLPDQLRLVWLTPAQDRLFLEGASERRRFLDRLAFAAEPAHAARAAAYDRAVRERLRLMTQGLADLVWLSALERQAGEAGAALAAGRARAVVALQAEIDARADRPFPQAAIALTGAHDRMAAEGASAFDLAARIRRDLHASRDRDAAAGRTLSGPNRTDLHVIHRTRDRPAAECSTGEQKALILNLVLAQAARLSRAESAPSPILLLDEVAAHLDAQRRAALFDEIAALGLQVFLTGTDRTLFSGLEGRAQGVFVDAGALHPVQGAA